MKKHNVTIIGIAGGTGSGKTTVVRKIVEALPENTVAVIPQDSYYKAQWDMDPEERKKTNFDHPDAFEWPLFAHQIEELRQGHAIEQPTYSYITCTRQKETVHVEPHDVSLSKASWRCMTRSYATLWTLKSLLMPSPTSASCALSSATLPSVPTRSICSSPNIATC